MGLEILGLNLAKFAELFCVFTHVHYRQHTYSAPTTRLTEQQSERRLLHNLPAPCCMGRAKCEIMVCPWHGMSVAVALPILGTDDQMRDGTSIFSVPRISAQNPCSNPGLLNVHNVQHTCFILAARTLLPHMHGDMWKYMHARLISYMFQNAKIAPRCKV